MTAKITRGLILWCMLVCGILLAFSPASAQEKAGSPGKAVWRIFGKAKKVDKQKKVKEAIKAAEEAAEAAKPPPPKPPPKLTVGKEVVDQEEFLFPETVAPSVSTPPKKMPEETSTLPPAEKEKAASVVPLTILKETSMDSQKTELPEEDYGAAPDINVQDVDNPWIPNIIEDFLVRVREKQVLVAYEVEAPLLPTIDGMKREDTWLQSPILEVPIERGPIVKIQAVYDEENIYFLLRWKDEAENREKNLWRFDGEKWRREGEEDRMSLMWDIDNSILDFNVHACGINCHDTDKNKQLHKMYTNADAEFADLWDWGASTSDPLGFAEDSYLDNQRFERKKGQHDIITDFIGVALSVARGGIHYDEAEKPASVENTNEDNTRPVYMLDPKKAGPSSFLTEDNFTTIDDYTSFKKGASIPGYLLRSLSGSRGDIQAKGNYKDGMWTLEIKRKLNTGHSDDVQFDPMHSYYFGIANFNNVRQNKHTKSSKCLLRFRRKQVYAPALFFGLLSVSIIYLVSLKKHGWEEEYLLAKKMTESRRMPIHAPVALFTTGFEPLKSEDEKKADLSKDNKAAQLIKPSQKDEQND